MRSCTHLQIKSFAKNGVCLKLTDDVQCYLEWIFFGLRSECLFQFIPITNVLAWKSICLMDFMLEMRFFFRSYTLSNLSRYYILRFCIMFVGQTAGSHPKMCTFHRQIVLKQPSKWLQTKIVCLKRQSTTKYGIFTRLLINEHRTTR